MRTCNEKSNQKEIKTTERAVSILLLFSALVVAGIFVFFHKFYFAFFIGFAIGIASFRVLAFTVNVSDRYPEWFKTLLILSTPFKFIAIGVTIFVLKLAGLSATQLLAGLLASQPAIAGTLFLIVYLQRKNVENNSVGKKK